MSDKPVPPSPEAAELLALARQNNLLLQHILAIHEYRFDRLLSYTLMMPHHRTVH